MRQRPAIGPMELPGAAPFAHAELRMMPPQRSGSFVVIGEEAGGVGDIDGGRQEIEHLPKISVAAERGLARLAEEARSLKCFCVRSNCAGYVTHGSDAEFTTRTDKNLGGYRIPSSNESVRNRTEQLYFMACRRGSRAIVSFDAKGRQQCRIATKEGRN